MKLVKAMATVGGLTFASRIAGFLRDVLTAAFLGAGPISDAFFVALKLPNLFRRVTAEGAFSVSFVPIYSKTIEEDGEGAGDRFASNSFSIMVIALSLFTVLFMMAVPWVIELIAPGFKNDPERFPLSIELSRITFPYLLLVSLVALFGGVLNAHNRFAPFAAAPVIFNLVIVAALLFATPHLPTAGHAMAWGISISGVIQLAFMWFYVRRHKIHIRFKIPEFTPRIKRLFKLMGPGVLGAGVMHINLFADMIIASLLQTGAISYLYYADRLNQLPLGVVGIAIGTALLPMLSRSLASGQQEESNDLFNRSLEYCFLLALPAAAALAIVPHSLITVLFERGEFTATDTEIVALVLMSYALGLPAYIAVKVFSTAFWANEDTVSPVKISIFTTLLNIALAFTLSRFIGVVGIALATGMVGWVQVTLLKIRLKETAHAKFDKRFKANVVKITLSTCFMGVVLFIVDQFLKPYMGSEDVFTKIISLTALVASGLISYAVAVILSGVLKLSDFKKYFIRKKKI
ncbi:MAG: murein biosynthesis integral membrane protein MurJ [Micavibrio sp.]|nr:murein biosynthesis integral membrane protein MurJ [Micavibrio sp.]